MNFIFSPIILIISISLATPSLDLYTYCLSFSTLSSPTIGVWGVLLSSLYFMYHLLTPSIVIALSRYIQYYSSPTIGVRVIALSRLSPYLPAHMDCGSYTIHYAYTVSLNLTSMPSIPISFLRSCDATTFLRLYWWHMWLWHLGLALILNSPTVSILISSLVLPSLPVPEAIHYNMSTRTGYYFSIKYWQ